MNLAIQGELGSFSHAAAGKLVPRAQIVPCARSRDVFALLQTGKVNAAVIPIENTLAGPVTEHYDLLLKHAFFIRRELHVRIEHNLIAAAGVKLAQVRRALSHPVALEQCRRFFERHPKIEPVPFYDTAGAVKHVVRQARDADARAAAAIAGAPAARQFRGRILLRSIEDNKQNFTRFFLLARNRRVLPGANKTSVAFALRNVPGALFKALSVFTLREISLSKIESRPVPGRPWEYVFFADLLIGDQLAARRALAHLGEFAEFVKVLGIYRRA